MHINFLTLAVGLAFSFLMCGSACADDTALSNGGGQSTNQRLSTTTDMLNSQEKNADYWEYGWGSFNATTMGAAAFGASRASNPENRNTDIVQASESLIGLSDIIFRPLPAFNADTVCSKPIHTEQDRADCLAAQQDLLQRSAERAQEPYELLPHLGNAGFNALAGYLIARVGNAHNAFNTAIPGVIIGEIRLWTMPLEPIGDYRHYKLEFSPLLQQANGSKETTARLNMKIDF